jgi:hypothetical protein
MNLLHRAVFAVRHCLTNEESRYTLNHIKITENEAQATNGHIALRVQTNGIESDAFPSEVPGLKAIKTVNGDVEEIRLSKQTADKLFKALPKNGLLPVLQNAYIGQDGDKPVIAVTDLDSSQVFRTEEVTGQFPDLDVLKKDEEPKARVCLDAFYLNEMCKVLRDFHSIKQGDCPILFELWEKGDCIVMSARNDTGQKLKAYLMPMDFDDDEFQFRTPEQLKKEAERRAKEQEEQVKEQEEREAKAEAPTQEPEDALNSHYQGDDVMKTPPENIGLPDTDDEDPDAHEEPPNDDEVEDTGEDLDTSHLDEKPDEAE